MNQVRRYLEQHYLALTHQIACLLEQRTLDQAALDQLIQIRQTLTPGP